ncbi:hypothetical protein [Pseudomonas gregormendelii]
MAKQTIALGTAPSGVGGDTPRSANVKVNANFDELYAADLVSYKKANVLGVVGQSGGVPTGALMEYISNGNGQAFKFASGLMIAVRFVASQPFNVAPGAVNFRNDIAMPVTFVGNVHRTYSGYVTDNLGNRFGLPVVDDSASSGNNGIWACSVFNSTGTPITQILSLQLTAIGRWF